MGKSRVFYDSRGSLLFHANDTQYWRASCGANLLLFFGVKTKQNVKQRLQRLLIRCSLCWGRRPHSPAAELWTGVETEKLFLWCPGWWLVRLPISWTSSIAISSHVPAVSMAMGYVCGCQLGILGNLVLCRLMSCRPWGGHCLSDVWLCIGVWDCDIPSQWFPFSPGKQSGAIWTFVVL